MVAALPIILGVQFILAFIGQDIAFVPKRAIHRHKSLTRARNVADSTV